MSAFKWAFGANANLREPIVGLKEKGWQYADIPTAANFNWLFNQIEKDLKTISSEVAAFKESINAELETTKEDVVSVKRTAKEALEKTVRHDEKIDWHIGVSSQICRQLREMEKALKRRYSDFPTQPWPLDDRAITHENEGE